MKSVTSSRLHISRWFGLSAIALLSFFATATEYQPNFKGTDINEFINIVGKNLNKTIIVDPQVRGRINVRSYEMLNEKQYYQFFFKRTGSLWLFSRWNEKWSAQSSTAKRCENL